MLRQATRLPAVDCDRRAVDEGLVIVIVAATRGSTPREAGARMRVGPDCNLGSIGGGHLEYEAIRLARLLPAGATGYLRFVLGASLGQCCGGAVELAFVPETVFDALAAPRADASAEAPAWLPLTCCPAPDRRDWCLAPAAAEPPHGPPEDAPGIAAAGVALVRGDPPWLALGIGRPVPQILLCGAGHVGVALAGLLAPLDCRLDWVDGRDDLAPLASLPGPDGHGRPRWRDIDPVIAVDEAPAGTHLVVMTHDHGLDYDIITRALRRDDLAFVGLIGSMTKRRRFEHRLRAEGFDEAAIARLHCPLGRIRTRDKSPQAIAIIVAAQLLALWDEARCAAA